LSPTNVVGLSVRHGRPALRRQVHHLSPNHGERTALSVRLDALGKGEPFLLLPPLLVRPRWLLLGVTESGAVGLPALLLRVAWRWFPVSTGRAGGHVVLARRGSSDVRTQSSA